MRTHRALGVVVAALSILAIVSPAVAESRIEKNLELQPKGQFVLESEVGSVTVTGSSGSGAHIVVTSDRDDLNSEFDFSFSNSGEIAHVTARRKHESLWSH